MILKIKSKERVKVFQIVNFEFVEGIQHIHVTDYSGAIKVIRLNDADIDALEIYDAGIKIRSITKSDNKWKGE